MPDPGPKTRDPFRLPAVLSFPLAALVAAGAFCGIVSAGVYARETALWTAQGVGQDWVDLLVVAPVLVVTAWRSLRGSQLASLLLGGAIVYAAYSLVLYAFAVHFNSLFLVYSVGLGFAFYALVCLVVAFERGDVGAWFSSPAPARTSGVVSILLGGVFYVLWLSEIVPALIAGATPKSLTGVGLITNPVQVLDVGIVLPAFIAGGLSRARQRPLGYWLVPVMLTFGVFMDIALIGMTLSMAARGLPDAGPPVPVFALMAAVSVVVLAALLRRLHRPQ